MVGNDRAAMAASWSAAWHGDWWHSAAEEGLLAIIYCTRAGKTFIAYDQTLMACCRCSMCSGHGREGRAMMHRQEQ